MSAADAPFLFCPSCRREFDGSRVRCPSDGVELRPVADGVPEPGDILDGRFLIVARIGSGGMGSILRAVDLDTRNDVAVKVLKARFAAETTAVAQFYYEARAARRLRHANIVRVESFGRSAEGHLYIQMELLDGFPLASLLTHQEPLQPALAVAITREICAALNTAHKEGVVHRDLKPENIQLIPDGDGTYGVKVLDFGIARIITGDAGENPTQRKGRVSGTPAYMSPEQVMGRSVDPRSDVYGLGVLLFEMLTGQIPFDDDDPVTLCRKHVTDAAPEVETILPGCCLPRPLTRLVAEMLRKSPDGRPQSVGIVAQQLERVARELGEPAPIRSLCSEPSATKARKEGGSPHPPLVRTAEGALRLLPAGSGDAKDGGAPKNLPDDGTPTLLDAANAASGIEEAATLCGALWVCPKCSFLNNRPGGHCESCGAPMGSRAVGIPVDNAAAFHKRPDVSVPFESRDTMPDIEPDVAPIELALLHVTMRRSNEGPERVRSLIQPTLEGWLDDLAQWGGMISADAGDVIRVVFGLWPEPTSDWLRRAAQAALTLRDRVNEATLAAGWSPVIQGALAAGQIFPEPDPISDVEGTLRQSSVDVAVRMTRQAAPGEILVNAYAWHGLRRSFEGAPARTFHPRESRRAELLFRLLRPVTPRPRPVSTDVLADDVYGTRALRLDRV